MAPLVAMLIAKGLPLLANLVLTAGSHVLKEKTGISIDNPGMLGEAEFAKLRQYEFENEENLRQAKLEEIRLEADVEKAHLADRGSARDMQIAALSQDDKFSKRFVYWLAICWSAFAACYIAAITFFTIPTDNIRFADTILGFLLGTIISTIVQFFFGSSKSSHAKDEVIRGVVQRVNSSSASSDAATNDIAPESGGGSSPQNPLK